MEKTEHYPEIKRYVKSKIVHPEDSEDLTQQVFLEYFKAKQRENNPKNSKAYLLGTAKIKVADYYRQKKKQPKLVQFKKELVGNILNMKRIDTSDQREITEELIIFDNLSYEEAAQRANFAVKIFYQRYYKGLNH
ncbi:MAG: sigma-70 family RNA polymerase sigma factor [Sedimentisphaerales bacterium]|nr:sigma-70 family RNA polymerase sigma factor [Sedimentisphaerales bacterium]